MIIPSLVLVTCELVVAQTWWRWCRVSGSVRVEVEARRGSRKVALGRPT